jgi:hypothetical protein
MTARGARWLPRGGEPVSISRASACGVGRSFTRAANGLHVLSSLFDSRRRKRWLGRGAARKQRRVRGVVSEVLLVRDSCNAGGVVSVRSLQLAAFVPRPRRGLLRQGKAGGHRLRKERWLVQVNAGPQLPHEHAAGGGHSGNRALDGCVRASGSAVAEVVGHQPGQENREVHSVRDERPGLHRGDGGLAGGSVLRRKPWEGLRVKGLVRAGSARKHT